MQNEFVYDDYVQPVCIRSVLQDIEELVGTYGTVVGWGWTEQSSTSSTLRQASIPVVSAEDCLSSDRNLFSQVLTTKVYCAGSRNGTSSCNGDSGGGMFFKMGGYWFLRGLTSFSGLDVTQNGVCDSHNYVGYTDVAKYITWLRQNEVGFEDPLSGIPGYNETLEYFATDSFKHVGTTRNSKYIRVGMVGPSDGIIRFGKSRFPYGESVCEVCLSGLSEQKTEVNRHTRTSDSEYINTLVKTIPTPKVLSKTRPLMFRLEVFDNGDVHLTKDAVQGCLLYDNVPGYNDTLEYFSTDNFRHVGVTNNSKYIRVGMVGESDATLRFGSSSFPYEKNVWEICLADQKTEVNRQTRSTNGEYINALLRITSTPNILSKTRPLMVRLEVFDNGNVHLTRDGERRPFLEFADKHSKMELDYIAFTQWNYDLFYFYDCPLGTDSNNVPQSMESPQGGNKFSAG
uniref:Uncharacterized protein n=1 Tax=Anopheles atroparvus TaxID=41427 RepID=A0A182ITC5_ANOAO